MRKNISAIILATALVLAISGTAAAKLPGQFSISANGGYMFTYGELELEYKEGVGAIGLNVGSDGLLLEIGVPIKYFVPIGKGFSFYVDVNPAALVWFAGPSVEFGIKAGPGIEFRSGFFKAIVEGGYAYSATRGHGFYAKGGLGIAF
ncbi:MAG TPA: hypothetical protein PKK63_06325 [Bacillota bacterium]|nr:MAG: hypothetical protein BWY00_00952 [Firmicutes bacterium ADurb.Bin153]HNV35130.1 hypothetical protein [Bacillota bacterium]